LSQSFYVSNNGPTTLSWSLANIPTWLTATPSSGSLTAGSSATLVTVGFTSAANALASGLYTASLAFTDNNTSLTLARPVTLQVSQSLIQNGGFETGDFTSWTLSGSTGGNLVTESFGGISPHSGNYFALLGQLGSLAYISQTVPTSPGQSYLLSFWLSNPTGEKNVTEFLVNWNTNQPSVNTIFSETNFSAFNWINEQLVVTATGTSTVLQFGFRDDPAYLGLDDVSLTSLLVAATVVLPRNPNGGVKVPVTTLLANDTDPNNETLTLLSAGPTSTNGGTVVVNGNWIFYTPAGSSTNTDGFSYSIEDTSGVQASGLVSVTVPADNSQSQNMVNTQALGNGAVQINFQGIVGRTYTIQYTESLQNPVWETLGTSTAGATGAFSFTDIPPNGSPARYYRSTYP